MNIGTKLNRWDNLLFQNARQFERLFNVHLNVPDKTQVEVLGPVLGGLRELLVGGESRTVNLFETDMVYSKELKRYVTQRSVYQRRFSGGRPPQPKYKYSIEKNGTILKFDGTKAAARFLGIHEPTLNRKFVKGYSKLVKGYTISRELIND